MKKIDLDNIKVKIEIILGKSKIKIKDFIKIEEGTILKIKKQAGEASDIYINECNIGKGEIIVPEENLTIRISEILNSKKIYK